MSIEKLSRLNKTTSMNKVGGYLGIFALSLVLIYLSYLYSTPKAEVLTKAMFNFTSYENLAQHNMEVLESICTKDAIDTISINNEDLLETTYYRFRGFPTEAITKDIVENLKYGRVVFQINNEMIDSERLFIIEFKKNFLGKVSEVHLYEVIEASL